MKLCIIYLFVTVGECYNNMLPNLYNGIKTKSYINGIDEHYIKTNHTEKVDAYNISRYMDILEKVNYLETNSEIIDEYTDQIMYDYMNHSEINTFHIHSGGLYNDWNYDI
jgi:hypothetical protein